MDEPLALVSTRSDFRTQSRTLCSRLFPAALSIFSIATLTLVLGSSVSAQDQTVTGGPCASGVSAEIENRPPSFFLFGLENFEAYVKNAFPVGSSEARLVLWLDAKGFGKVQTGVFDVAFADEPDEDERLDLRLAQGTSANLRVLKRPGLIGRSYYSVGWNADQCGRLVEVYPDKELNQMDQPWNAKLCAGSGPLVTRCKRMTPSLEFIWRRSAGHRLSATRPVSRPLPKLPSPTNGSLPKVVNIFQAIGPQLSLGLTLADQRNCSDTFATILKAPT